MTLSLFQERAVNAHFLSHGKMSIYTILPFEITFLNFKRHVKIQDSEVSRKQKPKEQCLHEILGKICFLGLMFSPSLPGCT